MPLERKIIATATAATWPAILFQAGISMVAGWVRSAVLIVIILAP